MQRFPKENLLSQSTDRLRRGTLLCSTRILVSKKLMENSEGGREGDYHGRKFCLTVPEFFVEDTFFVRQKIWYRKKVSDEGRVSRFSVKLFCLIVNHLVEE